jgi:hypothetical protein
MKFWDKWFRRGVMTGMAATAAGAASAQTGQMTTPKLPWDPKGTPAANLAMLHVETLLMNALKTERGVHVETLLTAVGALVGFAAQHAIWESIIKPGKLPAEAALVHAQTKDGVTYYFGDLLNSYLVPQRVQYAPPDNLTLYAFVAGAVVQAGKRQIDNTELGEIFAHTARTIGGPDFGIPRLPADHHPHLMPREALNKLWPATKQALQFRDPKLVGKDGEFTPRPPEDWPMIIGIVAQRLIDKTKAALDPRLGMQIVFEAAIPMSKIDPTTVPQ